MKQLRSTTTQTPPAQHIPFFLSIIFATMVLAFPLAAWSGNNPFIADSSTVALYHFDPGATPGDELKDASVNALHLTSTGKVQFVSNNLAWMSSPSGTVAHFSGPADKLTVSIPDNLIMPNTAGQITPFTIEARIFIRTFNGAGIGAPVISLYQNDASMLNLAEDAHSGVEEPQLRARNPANKNYVTIFSQHDSARTLTREEWHLFTTTVDANGKISVYVDNTLINAARAFFSWNESKDWTLSLGGFDGDLDELRISSGVRTMPATAPGANFKSYFQEVVGTSAQLPIELDYDGSSPVITWGMVSGPGTVAFSGQSVAVVNGVKQAWVNAQFPVPGKYVIRGEASDSTATVHDYMVVKVWPASGANVGKKVLITGHSPANIGQPSVLIQNMAIASGDTQSVIRMDAVPDRGIVSFWYESIPGADPTVTDFQYVHYLRDVISAQDWDVVVLTLDPRRVGRNNARAESQNAIFYSNIFARYLRQHGARLLLCACYRSSMDTAREIAATTQAKIAPVNIVYRDMIATKTPGITNAYTVSYPSEKSSYLNAYTIFYSLYGHAPSAYARPYDNFQEQLEIAVGNVITSDPALFFDTWTTP